MTELRRICVFCGTGTGAQPAYLQAAQALGTLLASRGIGLVYGGGNVGLMAALADAALAAGGSVTGVIPSGLVEREVAHRGVTDLIVVGSMHERKARMEELSDGFIALPGGFGTLEEFCEVLTWGQLGIHQKPCGLLNVGGFFDQLVGFVARAEAEGFIRPEHRPLLLVDTAPEALLGQMAGYEAPDLPRWVSRR